MPPSLQPAIDDVRIKEIRELVPPSLVLGELTASASASSNIVSTRHAIHRILHGADDRLLVIIGPCSIHDHDAALEYAKRLLEQHHRLSDDLLIVMRVYFEKPRTTVGWKGLINDPHLDGSFAINEGLRLARRILLEINELGMPAGTEFLDVITPQYTADLVSWGAIGARTTESQIHRELASGLSCPVGFKNGTDGNIRIAIDAIKAASQPHHFLAVTKDGRSAVAATSGNGDCHVVLRGGRAPNYDALNVAAACGEIAAQGLKPMVMIDASHANSSKNPENQPKVLNDVATQVAGGDNRIIGVMVESHLVAGRQDLTPGAPLTYGQSITDGCIDWPTSLAALDGLAKAVRARRGLRIAGAKVEARIDA
ncbi:phospho-2-dehydro-3-deoxyheptonate aldolase, Phe-sensitive [mine drainage metagenome]|uniref:3-deoxy-7-phosphoheptulonate synthase n=1 Tax=mine drainage metagenome TaxID=410659 RepID=A0A1J5Q548_9ZZZZ